MSPSTILGTFIALLGIVVILEVVDMGFSISAATRAFPFTRSPGPNTPSCPAGQQRREQAYNLREQAAFAEYQIPVPCHINNGDEALYPNTLIGTYCKGLVHNSLAECDTTSFASLTNALTTKVPADFQSIILGGTVKLTNPEAGLAYSLIGFDPAAYFQPPAPTFASARRAAEMAEDIWMALARDVNFDAYGTNPITQSAMADLATFTDRGFPAPTAQTLFRGPAQGCDIGPYMSQFFYKPCPFGPNAIDMQIQPYQAGVDFMTVWNEFLSVQNGNPPTGTTTLGPKRYIINGRDLARWVHMDVLFQAYQLATLSLYAMGAPLKTQVPYTTSPSNATEYGFATFGAPFIQSQILAPADLALRATWFQKWFVHRTLRPEEFGGHLDRQKNGFANYGINAELLGSQSIVSLFNTFGSYLLPQAFPEGCPTHPSYGSGHATVAGACSTMIKFFFQEDWIIPNPVMPTSDGQALVPAPFTLTVGNEVNKLASNVAYGRNIAGVHWRSDANAAMELGQALAVSFLRDQRRLFNEILPPWTATAFNGTTIVIS